MEKLLSPDSSAFNMRKVLKLNSTAMQVSKQEQHLKLIHSILAERHNLKFVNVCACSSFHLAFTYSNVHIEILLFLLVLAVPMVQYSIFAILRTQMHTLYLYTHILTS